MHKSKRELFKPHLRIMVPLNHIFLNPKERGKENKNNDYRRILGERRRTMQPRKLHRPEPHLSHIGVKYNPHPHLNL
ncbi:uncharacterized protein VP8 [Sesbania bispinosa]|nr:uncharacterized protein VP8 [Sesbania bispinosa]